jgi:hypothetical protein
MDAASSTATLRDGLSWLSSSFPISNSIFPVSFSTLLLYVFAVPIFCLTREWNLRCRCSAVCFDTGVEKQEPIKVMEQEVVSSTEHHVSGLFFLPAYFIFFCREDGRRIDRVLVKLTAFHVSLNYMRLLYLSLERRLMLSWHWQGLSVFIKIILKVVYSFWSSW